MKPETNHAGRTTGALAMLYRITEGQRHRYALGTLALVVSIGLEYLAPMVGQAVIDSLARGGGQAAAAESWAIRVLGGSAAVVKHLWPLAGLMVALAVGGGLLNFFYGRQIVIASERIMAQLRRQLFDHAQRLPCRYHDRHETGDLVQRCTSDVETIRRFMAHEVMQIVRAAVMLAAVIPLMLSVNRAMTGVAMSLTVPLVLFSSLFFMKVKSTFKKADEAEGKISARLQENLSGIRVVRAFARQEHEIKRFDKVSLERRTWHYRLYVTMAYFWSFSDFIGISQVVLVLGVGAYWTHTGTLTIGALYLFMVWAWRYIFPLRSLGRVLTELGKAQVAMGRVLEILDEPLELPVEGITEAPIRDVRGRIEFRDVSFGYDDEGPVLDHVSFVIKPGETVALLGPSGSGKTTVLALLKRFYDCESGSILLDGHDLRTIERGSLREQISSALQEPFLFSRTIEENIMVGNTRARIEDVRVAAESARIHESIEEFEDKYGTMVGERGVTLSGGQRQRVSLARALLRDAPILILDDTLSAVDSETEQQIIDALEQRHRHRTTLVVAHRLSTLSMADRILVFEHGRLVDDGTHRELRDRPGLYRRLWSMQGELEASLGEERDGEKQSEVRGQRSASETEDGKTHGLA